MKTIIITGAAGFVGVNLSQHLLAGGYKVIAIDVEDRQARLVESGVLESPNFVFHKANLRNSFPDVPIDDVTAIFHLAALPHVDYSYYNPDLVLKNNIESLITVINFATKSNLPLIFSSSVEYYGGLEDKLYMELDLPHPLSPYAASKVACEAILRSYTANRGLQATIFRFTNLYGPWQAPDRLVPRVISQILYSETAKVESGTARDFMYIDDACRTLAKSIELRHDGSIYNLSSGMKTDNNQAVRIIQGCMPLNQIAHIDPRDNDGRGKSLISSPDKLRELTGLQPTTSLEAGIARTVEWYRGNKVWLEQFEQQIRAPRTSEAFLTDAPYTNLYGS